MEKCTARDKEHSPHKENHAFYSCEALVVKKGPRPGRLMYWKQAAILTTWRAMESLFKQDKQKQKQESSTASLPVSLQPLLNAQSRSGVCNLRKMLMNLKTFRKDNHIMTGKPALKLSLVPPWESYSLLIISSNDRNLHLLHLQCLFAKCIYMEPLNPNCFLRQHKH